MKKQRLGQITVLALLLGLLGLTVGMSAAGRTLSDLKQVTYVDAGTKALAAAEAGLQYALNVYSATGSVASCTSPTDIPSGDLNLASMRISRITYQICATGGSMFDSGVVVARDDATGFSLVGAVPTAKYLKVYWSPSASVEIAVMRRQMGGFTTTRYGYNAFGVGAGNNFAAAASCGTECETPEISLDPQDELVRIRPLYDSSRIRAEALKAGTGGGRQVQLGMQTISATVSAVTTNNTVRKVTATKMPVGLPSVFDFALFAPGGITK
jgi:hypothetical protein